MRLDGAELGLLAEGTAPGETPAPAEVALVGPQGEVTAMSPMPVMPVDGAAMLAEPDGLLVEGTTIEPPEPIAAPVELQAEASAEPIKAPPPATIIEFNPQYPNVLVLPPPTTGDNSSFRSLQLD